MVFHGLAQLEPSESLAQRRRSSRPHRESDLACSTRCAGESDMGHTRTDRLSGPLNRPLGVPLRRSRSLDVLRLGDRLSVQVVPQPDDRTVQLARSFTIAAESLFEVDTCREVGRHEHRMRSGVAVVERDVVDSELVAVSLRRRSQISTGEEESTGGLASAGLG